MNPFYHLVLSVALLCTHYHGVYGVSERPWTILNPQQAHGFMCRTESRRAAKRSNWFAEKKSSFLSLISYSLHLIHKIH